MTNREEGRGPPGGYRPQPPVARDVDEDEACIVDPPPEPERSPYADPPSPSFSEAIATATTSLRGEIARAKVAVAEDILQQADALLGALKSTLLSDLRAGDERVTGQLGNLAEEMRGNVASTQAALEDIRRVLADKVSRKGVDLLSKHLGKIGRLVVALSGHVERLRAAGQEHETAHTALGERITDLVGTLGAAQTRIDTLRRASDEVRETLRTLRASVEDAGTRIDTLSSEIQSGVRTTQEVAGQVDGVEQGMQEYRAEVTAAREAASASEARTGARLTELEVLVASFNTDLASRASTEDVRRVEEGLRDARARLDATDSSLETLRAEGARRDKTLARIEKQLGGLDSRMNGFGETAKSLTAVDTALRTDLSALGGEVGTLQSELQAFDLRFGTAIQPVKDMEAQAIRLSQEFEAMRVRMDALASTMSGVSGASQAQEKRIGDVEGRLAVLNELAGLLERMQALDGKLIHLEGWRRVFAREVEVSAKKLGIAPPPWVATDKERPS